MTKTTFGAGFLTVLALVLTCIGPAVLSAAPLQPGTYDCLTLATMLPQTRLPSDLSEINRNAVEEGNDIRTVPFDPLQIIIVPAAFGGVILDSSGGYILPALGQSGNYGFDAATGRPTFTGDLGAMDLGPYDGQGTRFVLGWQGTTFECVLAGSAGTVTTATPERSAALVASAGPALITAVATDFDGTYQGIYLCGQFETIIDLIMRAKPDGTLDAVFAFGGVRLPEGGYSLGSFSMQGRWDEAHYTLQGIAWTQRPDGYEMLDLEGDLTRYGTAGIVKFDGCTTYGLQRLSN